MGTGNNGDGVIMGNNGDVIMRNNGDVYDFVRNNGDVYDFVLFFNTFLYEIDFFRESKHRRPL